MKMIGQAEVIKLLGTEMNLTKKEVKELLSKADKAVEVIAKALKVEEYGKLGSYIAVEKKLQSSRSGKNPKTGKPYFIEEKIAANIKKTSKVKKLEV